MKAFVLAAGQGERLWPLSSILPKVLWRIGDRPCVRWIVERLARQIPEPEVIICCQEKDLPLFVYEFRDMVTVDFSATSSPQGTAGEVVQAFINRPPKQTGEPVLIHYGDCLVDVNYGDLVKNHLAASGYVATLVASYKVRSPYGVIDIGEDKRRIVAFHEKPLLGGLTWTGIGVVDSHEIERVFFPGAMLDFGQNVFPLLLKAGSMMQVYATQSEYFDIGNIDRYREANVTALEGRLFSS